MVAPKAVGKPPRPRNVRSARVAAKQRRNRPAAMRIAALQRFFALFTVVLLLLIGYVMLISNMTGLNYSVARAERQRVALQDETARLDDRIAALRSQERLASIAAEFGMKDAPQFAIVTLPARAQRHAASHPRLAWLSTLGSLSATR
ncbi:MAG: hypothetical protein JO018_07795 [Candidatus Eremiobacteraeota bacterium]|nr:hypothetical protein [Candidatus Eremiobacteraeota bacterium]MBV9973599.1 hypothetical protein [Candidatus Eremiobacteraeota bacterium]